MKRDAVAVGKYVTPNTAEFFSGLIDCEVCVQAFGARVYLVWFPCLGRQLPPVVSGVAAVRWLLA